MRNLYIIGGSPCSGKSTVAEILVKKYDFYYFKVDDYLDEYLKKGAGSGYEICCSLAKMTSEQIWMREPKVQYETEIGYYEETFDFAMEDIFKVTDDRDIITEGAAFLPSCIAKLNIEKSRYMSITPTAEFQVEHYRKREWVPYILKDCSDKEKAFDNWMKRDILFAEEVRRQCNEAGYFSITNDGSISVEEMVSLTEVQFGLKR